VTVQFAETSVDVFPFPLSTVVECDFLTVTKKLCVQRSVFALKLLLDSCQSPKRRRYILDENSTKNVPAESKTGSSPSNQLRQLSAEKNNIEYWFSSVQVKTCETA
jgi:hypothetical protein